MKFVLLAADSGEADLAFYYSVVKKWVNRGAGVASEGCLGYKMRYAFRGSEFTVQG